MLLLMLNIFFFKNCLEWDPTCKLLWLSPSSCTYLGDEGPSPLVVILPAVLAASGGDFAEVQLQCVTGERCVVPVHVVLLTAALLQSSRAVHHWHRQPASVRQAPATLLLPLSHCRVPTPVIWSVPLKDNAHVHPGPGHGHQTEESEDTLLASTETSSFFQDVIKSSHDCRDVLLSSRKTSDCFNLSVYSPLLICSPWSDH